MHSSRLASAERMTRRPNSRNQRSSRKKRFDVCNAFRENGLDRRPTSPTFPNLRQNLQGSAYEKDFFFLNDRARHYWRAFFCYGYFPDCIWVLRGPPTLSAAQFWNTQSRRPAAELGRHGRWRRFAGRKHLRRRRKLRHVRSNVIRHANKLDWSEGADCHQLRRSFRPKRL